MTNKLILVALILCVSSSVDSLKLGNICKDGLFKYNELEVNSFYRIPQHVSLDPNWLIKKIINIFIYLISSIFQVLVHFVLIKLIFIFQMKLINRSSSLLNGHILIQWSNCYRKSS